MNNLQSRPFPKFSEYPQTEDGWNSYDNDWVARRRMTSSIAEIPKQTLEEHWASMSLGRERGWKEQE
jgi:hypothetical protein